ncbi:hypothetical protein DV736_g5045, partial [Chaetothyriales sp. CBS 134916]
MSTPARHDEDREDKLSTLSRSALLDRITDLEAQLHATQARVSSLLLATQQSPGSTPSPTPSKRKRPPKPFDPSTSSTRFIALKLAYLGTHYNGFEHANNNITPKPTVEEVLFKALCKTRLISPHLSEGSDAGVDVVWGEEERLGRGVSAFGQVIALRVRSSRPLANGRHRLQHVNGRLVSAEDDDTSEKEKEKERAKDCLSYVSLLNPILPPSIRILAWLPDPPPDFSARFSCRQRHYKYFFTNPAFSPTPGPVGMTFAPSTGKASKGAPVSVREGWLDIERMREAAKKLIGSHDFRNLCKIDPSNQMSNCVRSISHADIDEWPTAAAASSDPGMMWTQNEHLNMRGRQPEEQQSQGGVNDAPKVYTFTVHGSAFLWHQVRCMMGVLFLVGQGLEEPSVIDELLDIDKNPRRPLYEMAEDRGLVLWDCAFGDDIDKRGWVYAGDEAGLATLTSKTDGKFGLSGVVDVVWKQWRAAKMDEVLTSSLLGLVLSQGDGTAFLRGGFRDPATASRSQKIFDGGNGARIQGRYVRVMDKPKMATLEEQNDKYARTRKARRGSAASESQEQTAEPAAAAARGA